MEKEKPQAKAAKILQRIIKKRLELGITQKNLAIEQYLSSNGYFKIDIKKGDTLIFSSISHESDTFICKKKEEKNDNEILVLNEKTRTKIKTLAIQDAHPI